LKLAYRHKLLTAIRAFFDEREFVEVTTPICVDTPAMEDYIDAIPAGNSFLRTSPELHMKRLIADGAAKIYQIGPCFRADEHGRRHRSEFTMLEWYEAHCDYRHVQAFTEELLEHCARAVNDEAACTYDDCTVRFDGAADTLTVARAFAEFADSDAAAAVGDGTFDELLVSRVEPLLGLDRPCFLIDYPAPLAALARLSPSDPSVAERWELYIGGLEIANAYSELTDPAEQRKRFAESADLRRGDGREVYELDEAFLDTLDRMPPTGGCALGVDRLHMVLAGKTDIADVLPF
jgi:lysyl-tRNA synthetase class 2